MGLSTPRGKILAHDNKDILGNAWDRTQFLHAI